MAGIWQTVLQYFDKHPWLAGLTGGAVTAMLLRLGWKPMTGAWGIVVRWGNKRVDERVRKVMPLGTNKLSDLAKIFRLSPAKAGASLRRLEGQGKNVLRIHANEEDLDDEIWNKHS